MSSTTSHISQGDPTHGGAVFRLPREIRDTIYRLLVRGRYSANVEPNRSPPYLDLSVLRVSKLISHEAMEILYSESVFVFVIDMNDHRTYLKAEKFSRLKRIAPLMKNIDIDIETPMFMSGKEFCGRDTPIWDDIARVRRRNKFERNRSSTIGLFESVGIERRNLHIRLFLNCPPCWFRSTMFSTTCQRLGRLLGFCNVTVDITTSNVLLLRYGSPVIDTMARDLLSRVTHAVTEELQPASGLAIPVSKFVIEPFPTPRRIFRDYGRTTFTATLSFHPGKQSVKLNTRLGGG